MDDYERIATDDDFITLMRTLYKPSAHQIEQVIVPEMQFIVVKGKGAPEKPAFQQAVQLLYSVAFSLKMGFKAGDIPYPTSYFDFKVPPLEAMWWQHDDTEIFDRETLDWQAMIMLPGFVDQKMITAASALSGKKHTELNYADLKLEHFKEGLALQITHLGPYSTETATVRKLMSYAKAHGYEITGKHHEIYLSDPRRTKPQKLKTVVRYAVTA